MAAVRQAFGPLSQNTLARTEKSSPLRVPSSHLRQVRAAMSQPNLRARPHRLQPRLSRIDLLDQNLTSFPRVDKLHVIEDYFPDSPQVLDEPTSYKTSGWLVLVQRKLRWRWNVGGLLHG